MPQRRAVLIGVGSYEHLPTLPMVEDQLDGLRAVLTDPDSGGYEVTTVIDPLCRDLKSAFTDTLRTSSTGDTLILYFSGHGLMSDSSDLYFAGTDVDPEELRQTAYPAEELGRFLDASAASIVIVFLDCCYAGKMVKPTLAVTAASGTDALTSGDPYRRRSLITSSTDLELAHYDRSGSLFTSALMTGLKGGADLNRDGVVDTEELYQFVSSQLRDSGLPQLPALAMKGGGGPPGVVRSQGMRVGELVVPSVFVQAVGGDSATRRLLGLPDGKDLDGDPDPTLVRRLEELTEVVHAAAKVWDETVIVTWLRSNNDHLDGARPIDALALSGSGPVLAALAAEAEGVFA